MVLEADNEMDMVFDDSNEMNMGIVAGDGMNAGYEEGDAVSTGMNNYYGGTYPEMEQPSTFDKLMGSWVFVGGTGAVALAFGILCGIVTAKRKIKKGIDLYED